LLDCWSNLDIPPLVAKTAGEKEKVLLLEVHVSPNPS